MYLTMVEAAPEADAFFPVFDENGWETTEEILFTADEKHAYAMKFITLKRKNNEAPRSISGSPARVVS
jgi:dihydrofolate reductase